MRLLVVDPNKFEREALVRVLHHAHHDVEQVADPRSALTKLQGAAMDVVVMAWPAKGGSEFVRHLRVGLALQELYIVVVLTREPPSEVAALYGAGADDFMRRPCEPEELIGRVDGARRARAKATAIKAKSSVVLDWSSAVDLRRLRACQQMGDIVAGDLAALCGEPVVVTRGWSPLLEGSIRGATIPLSLTSENTEIQLAIVVDGDSLRGLGQRLLGDAAAPDAALDDVLRELANTAGGAVKRAGLEENVTLTTGLPATGAHPPTCDDAMSHRWVATIGDNSVRIGIVAEIRTRQNEHVLASKLKEGMVLARDLNNESGALLVPAGTRVTSTTAARIMSMLGERCLVEVANATN